jgi:hypothetical protein
MSPGSQPSITGTSGSTSAALSGSALLHGLPQIHRDGTRTARRRAGGQRRDDAAGPVRVYSPAQLRLHLSTGTGGMQGKMAAGRTAPSGFRRIVIELAARRHDEGGRRAGEGAGIGGAVPTGPTAGNDRGPGTGADRPLFPPLPIGADGSGGQAEPLFGNGSPAIGGSAADDGKPGEPRRRLFLDGPGTAAGGPGSAAASGSPPPGSPPG